ncbi:MAG TPA: carboxylesterase family protein [Vicinamibacterales bacterium]|nr:carboxylesterase family protein [Vicinamibacterales bacterium]
MALVRTAVIAQSGRASSARPPTERQTAFGAVIGIDNSATSKTYAWKGVPFAKPPVGDFRWKPPVDPAPWTSPRPTQQFGNACAQLGRLYGPGSNNKYDETIGTTLGKTVGNEDCLYLNIWRPATAAAKLPVIVFVHGGSNITGYTADPIYDGAHLAATADAVVVTVNYRLALLGFFNMAQLKSGEPDNDSGNFAMLDIIKSLQFISRNIAQFGGDPGNVTLIGESAGAVNVYAVMTSPIVVAAKPALLHRVLPMSGGISLANEVPPGSVATLAPATAFRLQANTVLTTLAIGDKLAADSTSAAAYIATQTPEQIAAYVRGKSADAILKSNTAGSGPIPDGHVVATDPIAEIKSGHYMKVPMLVGNTRDEARLFPTLLPLAGGTGSGRAIDDATAFSIIYKYDPNAAPHAALEQWIPSQYLPATTPVTGFEARSERLTQLFFLNSRDSVLAAAQAQQTNIWYYRFDWHEEPAPFNVIYGAAHAFDLPFAFGNFGPSLYANIMNTTANQPGRLALSDAMMRSIGAFARTGDPNDASLGVTWPVWPATLVFDATPTAKSISVH